MTDAIPQKVTVEEAATLWNTTENAVRKRIRRGSLLAVKENGRWYVLLDAEGDPSRGQATGQAIHRPQATEQAMNRPQIAQLEERITHMEGRIQQLEEERDFLRGALDKAQQSLLNQQTLALPDRMKEMKALPEDMQKRRWWQVWKR